jgi:hypothetical protein
MLLAEVSHEGGSTLGVSAGVCCTKCTQNTGVKTNFEIAQWFINIAVIFIQD